MTTPSFEEALAARERIGDASRTRVARWMVAWALRNLGRVDEALVTERDAWEFDPALAREDLAFALSVVLLVGAGLLLKSFVAVRGIDGGVRADNVLTARVNFSPALFPERPLVAALADPDVKWAAVEALGGEVAQARLFGGGAGTARTNTATAVQPSQKNIVNGKFEKEKMAVFASRNKPRSETRGCLS